MIQSGNPEIFAIESHISAAYASLGMRALGYFALHVGGKSYGVREHNASLLACSVDEVERRAANRGKHTAFFSQHASAGDLADAVYGAVYGSSSIEYPTFGRKKSELSEVIRSSRLIWAPDGDQAFDDGSFVLHFDRGAEVRLIGFRVGENARHEPNSLSDVRLSNGEFYRLLKQWRSDFETAWREAPKVNPSGYEPEG